MLFERLKASRTGEKESEGERETRVRIATAVVLLETAHADDEFDEAEQIRIMDMLGKRFGLDEESVHELMEAADEHRVRSIDIWHYTELINNNFSVDEKLGIIDMIWQVIYADGRLDKYEDYLVHKLSRVLHIPHDKMIEAKLRPLPKEE